MKRYRVILKSGASFDVIAEGLRHDTTVPYAVAFVNPRTEFGADRNEIVAIIHIGPA